MKRGILHNWPISDYCTAAVLKKKKKTPADTKVLLETDFHNA